MRKHSILLVATGILVLLAGGYLILCITANTNFLFSKTTINGIHVGKMSLDETAAALEKDAEKQCEDAVFTVRFQGDDYTVPIGDTLGLDSQAAAQEAFQKTGHAGFFAGGLESLKALTVGNYLEYPLVLEDTGALHNAFADSGLLDAGTTVQTTCRVENGQLIFVKGITGKEVDEEALTEKIAQSIQKGNYSSTVQCPETDGEVNPVDMDYVYEKVHKEVADATLDPANNYAVVDAVTGVDFDQEEAKKKLDSAEEGSTVSISLAYTEPAISTQDLTDHLFADNLATFTTVATGVSNRITNINLAAEKCNGIILLSGDVFSFNDTVGEQTEATGFKTANAIQNGNIVQAYGGGICQVSSTIFAAALFANLEIVERWNHDYVSSYIDAGMDAAVAWGALDFKVSNNKAYPIRIDVANTGGYLTVTIWGTKTEDTTVKVGTQTLENPSEDTLEIETFREVYNKDETLAYTEIVAYSYYRA